MTAAMQPHSEAGRLLTFDHADSVDSDRARLRNKFLAMPALCLTVAQVARLLNGTRRQHHATVDGPRGRGRADSHIGRSVPSGGTTSVVSGQSAR
jgi:hypothetical protein